MPHNSRQRLVSNGSFPSQPSPTNGGTFPIQLWKFWSVQAVISANFFSAIVEYKTKYSITNINVTRYISTKDTAVSMH